MTATAYRVRNKGFEYGLSGDDITRPVEVVPQLAFDDVVVEMRKATDRTASEVTSRLGTHEEKMTELEQAQRELEESIDRANRAMAIIAKLKR
jgi:carbamoylphosphate synthase large subunit